MRKRVQLAAYTYVYSKTFETLLYTNILCKM